MAVKPLRILLVEDNSDDAELIRHELAGLGKPFVLERVETETDFRHALDSFPPDLVLADYSLPRFTGMDALAILRERLSDIPLVIVTGSLNEETAVTCMKNGADDYVLKENLFKLCPALRGVLEKYGTLREKRAMETRLRETLQNLRAIIETSPLAISAFDLSGKVFQWNKAAERVFGWTEAETIGKTLPFLPSGEEDNYRRFLADFVGEGQARTWTTLRRKKSGESLEVVVHAALLRRGENEDPYGIVAVIEDRTEQIAAEAALAASERRFRSIFQESTAVMLLIEPDSGQIIDANGAAVSFYGYPRETLLGLRITQVNTLAPEELLEEMQKVKTASRSFFDFRHRLADGRIRDVEVYTGPVEIEGKILLFSVIHDVTERREAEANLRKTMGRLSTLLEAIPDAVYFKEAQGRYLMVNQAFERLLGLARGQVLGKTDGEVMPPDLAAHCLESDRVVMESLVPSFSEECMETLQGFRCFDTAKIPLVDEEGSFFGLVGVSRDITEKKAAQAELEANREELRRSLEMTRRSWEQTVELLSGLVELRDPYTAGHQKNVSRLAECIARKMGLDEEKVRGVRMAGTIHDVGKINVPAEILSKPGRLSDLEFRLVRTHPQAGWEALRNIDVPWPLADIVHQHHERLDGSGYPDNLKEPDILLEARIIAVADVVEAMSSHRPYRAAFTVEQALDEIKAGAGFLYDGAVVGACCAVFEEDGFAFDGEHAPENKGGKQL